MKISLTHCYTDKNKGDAAIIVATTQLIKKIAPNALINMYSTFGERDEQFEKEQVFISEFSDTLYPGMFYSARPIVAGSDISRIVHYSYILLKFSLLLVTKVKVLQLIFFSKKERQGIRDFLDSNLIISKGGSYITAQNNGLRQTLSLIHMLYPFMLAKRYNKKIVIFSQSLGPVKGKFNIWLMKKALNNIEKIFLREDVCRETYDEVNALCSVVDTEIIPDSAFYLKNQGGKEEHSVRIKENEFNVGFTIVDHAFKYIENEEEKLRKIQTYKESLVSTINYLVNEHKANVYIFPQVIAGNSHLGHNDVRISREIESICHSQGLKDKVRYVYDDFNPMQLRDMYSKMGVFIGTRLHSVIFSLSQNVPCINISYHGTKSQGILKSIRGFDQFVISIDDITPESLSDMVNKLIENKDKLKSNLESENVRVRTDLENAMRTAISFAE